MKTTDKEFSREYLAYCKANGRDPQAQLAHDESTFPGGCMTGFICWMSKRLAAFASAHPEAYIGHAIRDHDAKCDFLEATPINQ